MRLPYARLDVFTNGRLAGWNLRAGLGLGVVGALASGHAEVGLKQESSHRHCDNQQRKVAVGVIALAPTALVHLEVA